MSNLTDEDLMPFGKFKGTPMEKVPANYLLWLDRELEGQTMFEGSDKQKVWNYIEDNREILEKY